MALLIAKCVLDPTVGIVVAGVTALVEGYCSKHSWIGLEDKIKIMGLVSIRFAKA